MVNAAAISKAVKSALFFAGAMGIQVTPELEHLVGTVTTAISTIGTVVMGALYAYEAWQKSKDGRQ